MKVRKRQMESGKRRRGLVDTDEEKEQALYGTEIAGHSVNLALSAATRDGG